MNIKNQVSANSIKQFFFKVLVKIAKKYASLSGENKKISFKLLNHLIFYYKKITILILFSIFFKNVKKSFFQILKHGFRIMISVPNFNNNIRKSNFQNNINNTNNTT